jgi:hypothetical protein
MEAHLLLLPRRRELVSGSFYLFFFLFFHFRLFSIFFFSFWNGKQQRFEVKDEKGEPAIVSKLQIKFPESTDFYGRIIIYQLEVIGEILG